MHSLLLESVNLRANDAPDGRSHKSDMLISSNDAPYTSKPDSAANISRACCAKVDHSGPEKVPHAERSKITGTVTAIGVFSKLVTFTKNTLFIALVEKIFESVMRLADVVGYLADAVQILQCNDSWRLTRTCAKSGSDADDMSKRPFE